MKKAKAKNAVSTHTVDVLLEEMITEAYEPWVKQMERYRRAKPGSAAQGDALCELWALCNIVEIKAKVIQEVLDSYLDKLPDDDDE